MGLFRKSKDKIKPVSNKKAETKDKKQHIINFKVDEEDLAYLDAKAKRYGLSRSAMIKYFALNGEFTTRMEEQLKHPKL
jgi:hypothetical protein